MCSVSEFANDVYVCILKQVRFINPLLTSQRGLIIWFAVKYNYSEIWFIWQVIYMEALSNLSHPEEETKVVQILVGFDLIHVQLISLFDAHDFILSYFVFNYKTILKISGKN